LFFEVTKYFGLNLQLNEHLNDLQILTESVNTVRLKNFKYKINIKKCYLSILK